MFSTRYFDPDESIEFGGVVFFMDIAQRIDAVYSTIYRQEVRRQIGENPKFPKSSVF
jgi:hypothetical protein